MQEKKSVNLKPSSNINLKSEYKDEKSVPGDFFHSIFAIWENIFFYNF